MNKYKSIPFQVIISLFFLIILIICAEKILINFDYPKIYSEYSTDYPKICTETNNKYLNDEKMLERLGDDNGWRNKQYSQNMGKEYIQTLLDTLCINQRGYRDENKSIKIKIFKNQTYQFNKLGFRGKEWTKNKKENEINVFLVGGSTMFSLLSKEEHSIHTKLYENLKNQKTNNFNYRVFNASIPGVNSFEEYKIFKNQIISFDPDIVVFLTGYNNAEEKILYFGDDENYLEIGDFYSQIDSFLNKINLKKINQLIKNANRKSNYKDIDSRKQLIKFSQKSNQLCEENYIRCIFFLQPNLLVQKKSFSKSESMIKKMYFSSVNRKKYKTNIESYKKFIKHFKSNNFEFYDLSSLGNEKLFTGVISPSEKIIFLEKPHGININIEKKLNSNFKFLISNEPFSINYHCDKYILSFNLNNESSINCKINSSSGLFKLSENKFDNLYSNFFYSKKGDEIIFKISDVNSASKLTLDFNIQNHLNTKNIEVETSISNDNKVFTNVKKITKSFDSGYFKDEKIFDNYTGNMFIKLKFKNESLIGLKYFNYKLDFKKNTQNFFNKKVFKFENHSDTKIFVESFSKIKIKEFFIDSAHLTEYGNDLIAKEISKTILGDYEFMYY